MFPSVFLDCGWNFAWERTQNGVLCCRSLGIRDPGLYTDILSMFHCDKHLKLQDHFFLFVPQTYFHKLWIYVNYAICVIFQYFSTFTGTFLLKDTCFLSREVISETAKKAKTFWLVKDRGFPTSAIIGCKS